MANAPATFVGKYQILELVGEGAMGNVYRALDPVLNRTVAVKVMSDAIARDLSLRDRFMREAQAAGSLQHPNVVTIYDFGEVDGHLYIAMEYVDGIDLEQMIEQRIPMSLDDKLGIMIDVLVGLTYAHRGGIVHRDIKPANIRVTEDGRGKIMDFGVAHLESTKMTATGVMVGTPNYMAPEQVTGQKVGPATDIFAAAAVLYELLTHHKAFGAESLHNVLFKVVSEDPPPLAMVAPELPKALDPVLRKALAKESGERYQSAQEMANELTAIRAALSPGAPTSTLSLGATIAARTGERRTRSRADLESRRWTPARAIVASVVGALGLVGATWIYTWRSRPAAEAIESVRSDTATLVMTPSPPASSGDSASKVPVPPPTSSTPAPKPSHAEGGVTPTRTEGEMVAVVTEVRASAMRARATAAASGVAPATLAEGDAQLVVADRLAAQKRYPDAVAGMNKAWSTWSDAERTMRSATSASAPAKSDSARATPDSALSQVAPPPVVPPPKAAAPPASRTVPEAPPAAVEIAALVAEYARAIEARDLAAIKAVYPAISAEQQSGFQRFFATVKSLRARLSAGTPTINAASATAQVSGMYDYTDAAGKEQQQRVAFRATFRRDANRWIIVSVR
jgi:eukaryotic-like serine/threonine-protein kinase